MSSITRIIVAAVRANPTLAAALAFEAGILLMRAIQKNAGKGSVGRSAKTIEHTLLAHKPDVFPDAPPSPKRRTKRAPSRSRSRSRRRAAA